MRCGGYLCSREQMGTGILGVTAGTVRGVPPTEAWQRASLSRRDAVLLLMLFFRHLDRTHVGDGWL